MEVIEKYCSRAAFMRKGELVYFGDTKEAIRLYMEDNA
jgi:ABC-type polysaccharide/polyol phosphate transport system ATPase subunit